MSDLIQQYEKSLPIWINREGFSRPPLLALHHNGERTLATMAIPQEAIFDTVMTKFMTDLTIKEIVFGVDRYTKPGQGTKYKDVLTVFWWQGERINQYYGWEFGVINYRPPPRTIIQPIDWHNAFWTDIMRHIIEDYMGHMLRSINKAAATPGGEELVARIKRTVMEARERAERGEKPN